MKVVVGKMPGGRAAQVEISQGSTVLDAIRAAGYESDVNSGYEARLNNSPVELSAVVSENAIITLTSKITGNALSAVDTYFVDTVSGDISNDMYIADTPTIINDFINNSTDVKDAVNNLSNKVRSSFLKCLILENAYQNSVSDVTVYQGTIICSDIVNKIKSGDTVIFCSENAASMFENMTYDEIINYLSATNNYEEDDSCDDEYCCEEDDSCSDECRCEKNISDDITLKQLADMCKKYGMNINITFGF